MNVLIVDDDEITLELLTNALVRAGYDVTCATNGREALDRLAEVDCRLVISDWDMPELNGLELCQAIRAGSYPGYIYVILLTSRNTPEATVMGLSAGADDFVAKPFNPPELILRVQAGERVLGLETRDMVIFALAKLAESRDIETGAHLERVQCYSRALAQQLTNCHDFREQVDGEFIRLIYMTSPLHDIGKVGIPDAVLLKPSRLSDREFEIMKTHASLGAETLDAALKRYPQAKFLRMARDIAATHHERWDGKGYPGGLAGDDIPLCGRIVAVADVYDALTSRRVYKQAFGHEIARSMILEESGKHFDPRVVDAFIECEAHFIAIRERFAAPELIEA